MERYLGMDVHAASCTVAVLSAAGKLLRRDVVETNGGALIQYLRQIAGNLHLCVEESEWSQWLSEILRPLVKELVVFRVNRPALANSYPPEDRYPVRSVAVLCVAYFATFGSELAVVSMLPTFFADTWGLGATAAGFAASAFAFMNLASRPAGASIQTKPSRSGGSQPRRSRVSAAL